MTYKLCKNNNIELKPSEVIVIDTSGKRKGSLHENLKTNKLKKGNI